MSKVLVKQRDALDEILQVAPAGLSNLFHTYNPATGTLDTRTNVGENIANLTADPVGAVLRASSRPARHGNTSKACSTLRQALPAQPPRSAGPEQASGAATDVEHVDRSLGGILEVRDERRPHARPRAPPAAAHRALATLMVVAALALTGCDFSVYNLPLPGGADLGDNPITVTIEFRDVIDLVPQTSVKVDDVTVGKVDQIKLDGYHAEVTVLLRNNVKLPDNAEAKIRQTSLLGEKFVSLAPPTDGASSGRLGDGDTIPLERTGRNPEVEEVLGALSLLLNGGGVAQLKTISTELNKALGGREGSRPLGAQAAATSSWASWTTNKDQIVRRHREPQPARDRAQQAEAGDHARRWTSCRARWPRSTASATTW